MLYKIKFEKYIKCICEYCLIRFLALIDDHSLSKLKEQIIRQKLNQIRVCRQNINVF